MKIKITSYTAKYDENGDAVVTDGNETYRMKMEKIKEEEIEI